ncbi:MAG: DNA cytosine methyltransferase [Planctomycetota bacterium]
MMSVSSVDDPGPRLLEFYAGLGGVSTAWPEAHGVAAFDINQNAQRVFEANHDSPYWVREIESLPIEELAQFRADLWWLSPPCQPFTRKGMQRASEDSRSNSFERWLSKVASCSSKLAGRLPSHIVVENVVGFEASEIAKALKRVLQALDYRFHFVSCCPTEWGWPNRRPRVYAVATRKQFVEPIQFRFNLRADELLEKCDESAGIAAGKTKGSLLLDVAIAKRYAEALDVVEPNSTTPAACFTSSYGKSWVRSGSYLRFKKGDESESASEQQLRFFSPREVSRLLGFPPTFEFAGLRDRTLWKLFGNSLALPAVRFVLSHFENGPRTELPWWPKCECSNG